MAISTNFELYVGTDNQIVVQVFQQDDLTPQNITGWSISFFIINPSTGAVLVTKSVGAGIVLTTPANGILTITLNANDTLTLLPRNYNFFIQRTDSGYSTILTTGLISLLAQ
jgi:hypothetical protein